jgi:hypothetical protein
MDQNRPARRVRIGGVGIDDDAAFSTRSLGPGERLLRVGKPAAGRLSWGMWIDAGMAFEGVELNRFAEGKNGSLKGKPEW